MLAFRDPDSSITLGEIFVSPSRECPKMPTRDVMMLCDTGCPHVAHILQDILCFMHWNVLDYLPYSLDLTPCDLTYVAPFKKVLNT